MKNFNADGLRAFNQAKCQAAREAVIDALRAAGPAGATVEELVLASDISDVGIRTHIRAMRASGLVHICSWRLRGTQLVAVFAMGAGDDAKEEDYMHLRREKAAESAEAEARKEARRRHAAWQSKFRPHRDAAAAWL
ncbi:hypothetical protein V8918_02710 [Ralstonia mannitolilytica]|uniref:hypothetical protein n=1 Tax=Ralstonia mannitolilytica TaxID=105219 RepID=UPI003B83D93C